MRISWAPWSGALVVPGGSTMAGYETYDESEHCAKPPAPPRRVLVVDDNVGSAQMMSIMLTKFWKHDVRVAHDAQQRWKLPRRTAPTSSFSTLACRLSVAMKLARLLRENPEFHQTLLVALTGYDEDEDRRRRQEAGFRRAPGETGFGRKFAAAFHPPQAGPLSLSSLARSYDVPRRVIGCGGQSPKTSAGPCRRSS